MLYSEDSLNILSFRISQSPNLSEASISRFLRNAYVAVGTAGISAAILGSLILLYPRLATASWPFTGAQAADGSGALLHDPGLNLLEAAINPDPNPLKDDQQLVISGDSALLAEGGIDSDLVGQLPEAGATAPENGPKDAPAKEATPKPTPKPAVKAPVKTAVKVAATAKAKTASTKVASLPSVSGYFGNPLPAGHLSQGLHGKNAVDIAAPAGTTIYAAAAGTITTVKSDDGWNGGYGNYVVVTHPNGTTTLYAHMSSVAVSGGSVAKGQVLGYVGRTGEATGNHLHFEVHGAANPFAS